MHAEKGPKAMKSTKTGQKSTRIHRIPAAKKRRRKSSTGKPSGLSLDTLSGYAFIKALRGSCKGSGSLSEDLKRERRREDQTKDRKFVAQERELKARMLESR